MPADDEAILKGDLLLLYKVLEQAGEYLGLYVQGAHLVYGMGFPVGKELGEYLAIGFVV